MGTFIPRSTRLAALMVALMMTAAVHGVMLWQFDSVAQQQTLLARANAAPTQVTLERVNVVGRRT